MMRKITVFITLTAIFFASCASIPAAKSTENATDSNSNASMEKNRAKELITGNSTTSVASTSVESEQKPVEKDESNNLMEQVAAVPGQLSAEEQSFLENHLARLQYMVYYDDETGVSPSIAKTAVSQANRYLLEKLGMTVIDFDQIEKNRKDQEIAYQNETGGSIDLIQYLAQKFNADAYVEISFTVDEKTENNKFYSTAKGSLKIFDPSTAQLLGSISFQSPQAFSPVSQDLATQNAVASSVWTVMPKTTEQTKSLIRNSLSNGIRYELILQNTADAKTLSSFRRQLSKKVRLVEQISYSPNETKLVLYTFQNKNYVEDAIWDSAERGGFPDIYLVYQRGKSFTFNTGM